MNKTPNILFILSDQHRFDGLGRINRQIKTPCLDELAGKGIFYENAVCQGPMCVPSRYSLMTGLYPSQVGVRHNTQSCPTDDLLPVPVLAERLRDAGFQTGGFGKTHWQVNEARGVKFDREDSRRGFQKRAVMGGEKNREEGCVIFADEHPGWAEQQFEELGRGGAGGQRLPGYLGWPSQLTKQERGEYWLAQKARDFMREASAKPEPFFCYFSVDVPHPPLNPPKEYELLYSSSDIDELAQPPAGWHLDEHTPVGLMNREAWAQTSPEERRGSVLRYYAMCSFLDDLVKELLDELDACGCRENTLVIYASDHGEMLGQRNHRFAKMCLYEASVRVPLILSGYGVPAERVGKRDPRYSELVDIMPTILRTAGIPLPEYLPGEDLLGEPLRPASFSESHGEGYHEASQLGPSYMWRDKNWKLILTMPGDLWKATGRLHEFQGELYNLQSDPHEWQNRYSEPELAEIRERMTRDLLLYLACQWAKFPFQPSQCPIQPSPNNPPLPFS